MMTKDYLLGLLTNQQIKPKNPYLEDDEGNDDLNEEGISPYKVLRAIFSGISVLLSLFLVVTIHAAKGNWILTICLGLAIAIIAIYNELQKDKSLDILFQCNRLSKELLGKEERKLNRRDAKKAQPIAIGTVLLSLLITGSAIFMFVIGDKNHKISRYESIAQAKSDSINSHYTKRIDSIEYLLTTEQINRFINDNDDRIQEMIKNTQSQKAQATANYNSIPKYKRGGSIEVNYNSTISELNDDIERFEKKRDLIGQERKQYLNEKIAELNSVSGKKSYEAYRSVMGEYESQARGEAFVQLIMGGATVIVESLIVLFSMLLAKSKTQFAIDKDRFDDYIKSLEEFKEMKSWLSVIEELYSEVGHNSSFSTKQRQELISKHFSGKISDNRFASVLKNASIIQGADNRSRKLAISEYEAKNNIVQIYHDKISGLL